MEGGTKKLQGFDSIKSEEEKGDQASALLLQEDGTGTYKVQLETPNGVRKPGEANKKFREKSEDEQRQTTPSSLQAERPSQKIDMEWEETAKARTGGERKAN